MNPSTIVATLVAAAAFLKKTITEVSARAIQDSYNGVKRYLRHKLGAESSAGKALEMATDKPDSIARKSVLIEELESSGLREDSELDQLVEQLRLRMSGRVPAVSQTVHVPGDRNNVQVAGRDIITTLKHIQRNVITPDERHLSHEQCDALRRILGEVARRLADEKGVPNYAAVHRFLQRRYSVPSYLLIPTEKFEDALLFLKRSRAALHSRSRRTAPVSYEKQLFRSIYSAAGKLKWNPSRVCGYAVEILGLRKSIASLKELGPFQLKTVAESIAHEVVKRSEPR